MGVEGFPGVWALGDCAVIPDEKGGYQPPTAQHASRDGKVLAHNIVSPKTLPGPSEPLFPTPIRLDPDRGSNPDR